MTKRYISPIISLFLFAITITPSLATLPNEAVFNWVEYKFTDLFPKSQTIKSELIHNGVHYDLRSWSGAWGTRYLGITDDGEIFGLGDFTDGELISFGYVEDFEAAVVADEDNVFSNLNPTVSFVVSETPDYSLWNIREEQWMGCFSFMPVWHFNEGMDGRNRAFFFPTMFFTADNIPGMEFVETEPDKFTLTQRLLPNIEIARAFTSMDTERTDIKRFAITSTGAELAAVEPNDWNHGDTWVVTDYGDGFEFEIINDDKSFYHGVASFDIDNDGYDELIANNMGSKSGPYEHDAVHAFDQIADGVFEQYNPFDREELTQPESQQGDTNLHSTGSVLFADFNNDGFEELVQGAGNAYEQGGPTDWGGFRVWEVIGNALVEAFVAPREGLWDPATTNYTASGLYPLDYNNDGLPDLVAAMEAWWGTGVEIYRNDGNLQFTRVTEEVFPNNHFDSDYIAHKEMSVTDVNADGLEDIVLHPTDWSVDINQGTPGIAFPEYYPEDSEFPGMDDRIPWNMGAAIYLNTGSKFVRQIDNPAYTINILHRNYPKYLRFMDTKDGVVRFFGISYLENAPVVMKVEL